MSIPRELTLRRIGGKMRMCQKPVQEFEQLRDRKLEIKDRSLTNESLPIDMQGQQVEILVDVEPMTAMQFGVRVLKGKDEQTVIGYDTKSRSLSIDRTNSGNVSFHPAFSGRHAGPLEPDTQGHIRLRILVDACSVEVFGNDGETVVTDLVFPDPESNKIELFASGGSCRLVSAQVHALKSVWPSP
jgi:fructan beta-fructosidase